MIILDANVLIAHLNAGDAHAARAFQILDTDDELALHPLTLAESLVRPAKEGRLNEATEMIDSIGIQRWRLDADEPARIALLRATTGLRLPDCCVLATAIASTGVLATFDAALAAAARELGIEAVGT